MSRSTTAVGSDALISGRTFTFGVAGLLWQAVRLSAFALLAIVEPLVAVVLSVTAFLSILSACVLRLWGDLPHFPFWGMVGVSIGCMLLLMSYYGLMSLFHSRLR